MKQSKTTIKELQKRYRAVLLHCAMIAAAMTMFIPSVAYSYDHGAIVAPTNEEAAIASPFNRNANDERLIFEGATTISGGTVTGSDFIARNDDSNLTVTGGTFNNTGFLASWRTNTYPAESAEGSVTINGGSFEQSVISGKNITINGGNTEGTYLDTFPSDTVVTINGGTHKGIVATTSGTLYVSGGTFSEGEVTGLSTLPSGAYMSNGNGMNHLSFENISITGGDFTDTELLASGTVSIYAGTFRDSEPFAKNIHLYGGDFDSGTEIGANTFMVQVMVQPPVTSLTVHTDAGNATVNGQQVAYTGLTGLSNLEDPITVSSFTVEGSKALTLSNSGTNVENANGKFVLNNSYLGAFTAPLDVWQDGVRVIWNETKRYSDNEGVHAYRTVSPNDSVTIGNGSTRSEVTMNNNSALGAGFVEWSAATRQLFRAHALTQAEIDTSVNRIKTALNHQTVNLGAVASVDDAIEVPFAVGHQYSDAQIAANDPNYLADMANGGFIPAENLPYYPVMEGYSTVVVPIFEQKEDGSYGEKEGLNDSLGLPYIELQAFLQSQYGSDDDEDILDFGSAEEQAKVQAWTEAALRGNYQEYNDAFNSYAPTVTITNTDVTANGNNALSAANGTISFENSNLKVNRGATLDVVSANNTVSFDATSVLDVDGTVNGNVAFSGATGKVKANNGTIRGTMTVSGTNTLDMSDNNQIDALTVDKLTVADGGKLAIDVNAAQNKADSLTVGAESSGTLTITALNGIQAGQNFTVDVIKGAGAANVTLAFSDELRAAYDTAQERHEERAENLKADSDWSDRYGTYDWIISEGQHLSAENGKVTYASNVTERKGELLAQQDTLKLVNTDATIAKKSFTTTDATAVHNAAADLGETKGAVTVTGAINNEARSTIALGAHTGFVVNRGATLKLNNVGITGDANVLTVGQGATAYLNNVVIDGTVTNNGTLDIGESALTVTTLNGGILKATLTAAAETAPIVTATADSVTLALDMSKAARGDEATMYHITSGTTGYTFGEYDTRRYAVSAALFDKDAAKEMAALSETWHGGDLYIMKLATAGEAAVEDLKNIGVHVTATEEKAAAVLADEVMDRLAPAAKAVAQRVNTLLENMAGNAAQMKQVLREVAPEAAPATTQTASANAGAVMNVVGGRMGGAAPAPAARGGASNANRRGRSGGDYTAGALSAWAQGMYNRADLHKADGFDADSKGFAAGLEYAVNDSVKAGIGYAFTRTDIDTTRSTTDVDTHTGFVYGEYKPENFYVNGVLSYGHSTYDETTRLAGLNSEYRANTFAGQIMTGYTFGDFTPEAGLRYTGVRQRSYTNALGAKMASQTLDTWTWVAGVNASKSFREGDIAVTPNAKLALTYDFKRDGQARTVTLANGSSYVADGEAMKRFGVEVGAGVSATFGQTEVGLSYEGKFKDHYTDHTGMINVKYNF